MLKEQKEFQYKEMQEQLGIEEKNIYDLKQKQQKIEEDVSQSNDLTEFILEIKQKLKLSLEQEKELLINEAELSTKVQEREKSNMELKQREAFLQQEKSYLHKLQKTQHWLDNFFLPLTISIEKHILLSIHRQFNQLFQEWFSLLIDNEQITARIDEVFTPVIEQNGYEIFFEHLSGGERTSAALAYRLALNRVINEIIHQIKTKELFILDEPTDGFSSEQLDRVREVLQKLQLQQLIIVSHESKIESFVDSVIRVQKEGNESRIVG